jgi:hypothetical protein
MQTKNLPGYTAHASLTSGSQAHRNVDNDGSLASSKSVIPQLPRQVHSCSNGTCCVMEFNFVSGESTLFCYRDRAFPF